MAENNRPLKAKLVLSLEDNKTIATTLENRSRMTGDCHVRICESWESESLSFLLDKEMWDYGGKTKWKRKSGYSKRNLAETQMFRWKQIFGPKLLNRKFENQKTETMLKANVLNKLTSLGMPKTQAFAV